MNFEGIYTPVITPHHDDQSIDEKGLETVINHLIDAGVHGLILAGTTGEYYAQSMQERMDLMPVFKGIIDGRVPLIVGTGALRTEESIEYAEAAAQICTACTSD